jgi:putative superfamily III holin-X
VSTVVPPPPGHDEQTQNIATAIAEVSERATLLVREEIELAKAEVTEKGIKFAKGAVVGIVAGVFFIVAIMLALEGCAWLLYYYLPGNQFTVFWGFFAMAVILIVLGVIAGLIAARFVKKGAPPVPTMAIEEARKIRDTVSAGVEGPHAGPSPAGASLAGTPPAGAPPAGASPAGASAAAAPSAEAPPVAGGEG